MKVQSIRLRRPLRQIKAELQERIVHRRRSRRLRGLRLQPALHGPQKQPLLRQLVPQLLKKSILLPEHVPEHAQHPKKTEKYKEHQR